MVRSTPYILIALLAAPILFWAAPILPADSGLQVIPLARYQLLSLESQTVHSPGAGVVVVGESLVLVGVYSRHLFEQDLEFGSPDTFHSIPLMADGQRDRHRYLGFFKSESESRWVLWVPAERWRI